MISRHRSHPALVALLAVVSLASFGAPETIEHEAGLRGAVNAARD
jgi:hypothetical protein